MENIENKIPNGENQDTQNSSFFSENVSSSNGLEPKLRFPNFIEKWTRFEAENIFKNITDKNHPTDTVLTIQQGRGTLPRDLSGRNILYDNTNTKNYKRVQFGDFIIHLRSFEGGLEMANEQGIVSPAYTILRYIKPIAFGFYKAYFRTNEFINHILSKSVEGIRDGKQISYDAFKWLAIPYCQLEEQQKIADFLSLVDQRIEKQRQLVESLKKYKRGLLSAIFDRKLRFKDTDFSLWKNVRLSECCLGFDNKRQPISSELREKGTVPYYGANGIQDYVKDYIFDGEYILLAEDGGHFDEFQTKPIAQYITGKSWVNNHAHILQATEKDCTKYIYYALVHKDIRKYINGSSRAKLNQEDMWQIVILLPNLKQQIKIAQFMSSIDKILSIEEKMLTVLEEKKQGLLQQMFI